MRMTETVTPFHSPAPYRGLKGCRFYPPTSAHVGPCRGLARFRRSRGWFSHPAMTGASVGDSSQKPKPAYSIGHVQSIRRKCDAVKGGDRNTVATDFFIQNAHDHSKLSFHQLCVRPASSCPSS